MLQEFLSLRSQTIKHGGHSGAGLTLSRRLTAALDTGVAALLPEGGRLALVAVGGYGRGELCLYSDVDLMLLHPGSLPAGAERVFYPLWDAGLKVGHAIRSPREAVQAAREDLQTLTALLDARLVTGDATLFGELRHSLGEFLHRGRIDLPERLAVLESERATREPYPLQELDVKDGRGGLRALQGLHWEARARELAARGSPVVLASPAGRGRGGAPDAPPVLRLPSHPRWDGEMAAAHAAHDTLLATRNALHAVSGKAFDIYVHDLHHAVADWLHVDSDRWSRRLYGDVRVIDRVVSRHWQQERGRQPPAGEQSGWRRNVAGLLGRRAPSVASVEETLAPAPAVASVFEMAAGAVARPRGELFTPAQETAIRAAMGPMWTAADREGFLALLRAGDRGREVFDALDALGWAERALPEWSHVRGLPQYAPFHLHPVDVHLWRTVEETLRIARRDSPEPPLAGVAAEIDSLDDALLAALLHDIGKGWPGDHSIVGAQAARAFCRRAQFGPRTTATVARAIEHHLLLPTIATRRDLDDPTVIRDVADSVGDGRTLRVLYLLSVADSRATGPAVWSRWKGTLLQALFDRTDDELRRRQHAVQASRPPFDIAPLVQAMGAAGEGVARQHLAAMPPGYPDSWSVGEIAQHIRLMWPPPGPDEVRIEVTGNEPASDLMLAVEDRPGLISITSGVLALHDISVLGGRFVTRSDGVALQAFHVADTRAGGIPAERWARVQQDVPRVLRGDLDLEAALREKGRPPSWQAPRRRRITPRVVVDAEASERATLVEVHAEDRVGLLHTITRALFELRLDINIAKVDTLGREVVDVFYVRDLAGHPPRDAPQLRRIEKALQAALAAPM